jgi:hypothetical protein
LLRAAIEALTPGSREHLQIVKDLLDDHLKAAREIIRDTTILEPLERQIEYDCIKLKSFLEAAQVSNSSTIGFITTGFCKLKDKNSS